MKEYSISEWARLAGVSVCTVCLWAKQGKIRVRRQKKTSLHGAAILDDPCIAQGILEEGEQRRREFTAKHRKDGYHRGLLAAEIRRDKNRV